MDAAVQQYIGVKRNVLRNTAAIQDMLAGIQGYLPADPAVSALLRSVQARLDGIFDGLPARP